MAPLFFTAAFLRVKATLFPRAAPTAAPCAPPAPTPAPPAPSPSCRARLLPAWLYALASVGRRALDALADQPIMLNSGITRFMFLDDKINAFAADPFIATRRPSGLARQRYRARRAVFSVPGFCYARLFADEWFYPAIATLGPYPLAADVVRLSIYFSQAASRSTFAITSSSTTRHGKFVSHIKGHNLTRRSKVMTYDPVPRLRSMGSMVLGAAPGGRYFPHDFPPLPPSQPVASGANSQQLGNRRLPSNYQTPEYVRPPLPPPHTPLPPRPMGPPPAPAPHGQAHGPAIIYGGMAIPTNPPSYTPHAPVVVPRGRGGPSRNIPRGVSRVFRGNAPPRPKRRAPSPAPYQPFHPYPSASRPRQSSPSAAPIAWKSATRDAFDELLDQLQSSLSTLPRDLADSTWNDFLVWLADLRKTATFSRSDSLPEIQTYFDTLYSRSMAQATEDERRQAEIVEAGNVVARMVNEITALEDELAQPVLSRPRDAIVKELRVLRQKAHIAEVAVDTMLEEQNPPSEAGNDQFARGDDFIPVVDAPNPPVRPWPEGNYSNFEDRTNPLFPKKTGKTPLADLAYESAPLASNKILLPRSLKLYTTDELREATAKNAEPWRNRFEDPCEPVKCWSWATYSAIYEKPGFRFLTARVAQIGPQFRDPKLPALRSALSRHWGCPVEFEMISPRLDWMMCTIPSLDGPAREILDTALIRMYDGNASYVVRHLDPLRRLRELDLIVRFVGGADQVFDQLKKRILEFKAKGVPVNFRVMGVRRSDAPNKWRATFLLDDPKTYWPWTHDWGHPHGTVELESPLLNFENSWKAVKPYACRLCYNSDHYTQECSLPRIKIGGVSLVSLVSRDRVLHRRFPERMTIIDRSLEPAPPAPPAAPADSPSDGGDDAPSAPGAGAPDAPDAPGGDNDESASSANDDSMDTDGNDDDQADQADPESDSSSDLDDALVGDKAMQVRFFQALLARLPAPALPCDPVELVSLSGGHLGTAMRRLDAHFTSLSAWDEVSLYRQYTSFIEQSAAQPAPLAPILEESVSSYLVLVSHLISAPGRGFRHRVPPARP